MSGRTLFTGLAMVLAASGCGGPEILPLEDDPTLQPLAEESPADVSVGVAPLVIDFNAEQLNRAYAAENSRYAVRLDPASLRHSLMETIRRFSIVRSIDALDLRPGEDPIARADAAGLDLLLRLTVREAETSYVGRNGKYVWAVLFFLGLLWPAWLVPDEVYKERIVLDAELIDVRSESTVMSRQLVAEVTASLDDFDRGWGPFGLLGIPQSHGPGNWEAVHEVLGPAAEVELERRLLADLGAPFRTEWRDNAAFRARAQATYAICIGISRYSSDRTPPIPYAADDARAFADFCSSPDGLAVPAKNRVLLVDDAATQDAIRGAIDAVGHRARADDRLIIYFAGYGTSVVGAEGSDITAALAPYDAEEQGTLSIPELGAMLPRLNSGDVIWVMDASFGGSPGTRCLRTDRSTPPLALFAAQAGTGRTLLLAAQPTEGARSAEDLGHGLFTYYFLQGATGPCPELLRRPPTVIGAYQYASRMVELRADLDGFTQQPVKLGAPRGELRFGPGP